MRSFLLLVAVLVIPHAARAQCADNWIGIQTMKGTFTLTGNGSSATFTLNQSVNGSPNVMGAAGTFEWMGLENGNVSLNETITDVTGTATVTANGPALAGTMGPGEAILGMDPNSCTYSLYADSFVEVTDTATDGTVSNFLAAWGPPSGLNITNQPLPMTGTELTGSQTIVDTTSYPGTTLTWTISWDLDGAQMCSVTLPVHYGQADAPWGSESYDHVAPATIAQLGCAMTSFTMALHYAGWNGYPGSVGTDPGSVDTLLDAIPGGYNSHGAINFDVAARQLSALAGTALKFDPLGGYKSSVTDPQGARMVLDKALCDPMNPHPVIIGVKLHPDPMTGVLVPGHFVLVTAKTANGYTIADPGKAGGVEGPLTMDFITRGIVKDPPGDISALDIAVDQNAAILVTDPGGHASGVDPTQGLLQQIPQSAAGGYNIVDDVDGTTATPIGYSMQVFQPVDGDYTVVVQGLAAGPFELAVNGFTQSGAAQQAVLVDGMAQPGVSITYYVHYSSTDGSMTTVDQTPATGGGDTTTDSHTGGCGCRAGGDPAGVLALLAAIGLVCGRRRQRAG